MSNKELLLYAYIVKQDPSRNIMHCNNNVYWVIGGDSGRRKIYFAPEEIDSFICSKCWTIIQTNEPISYLKDEYREIIREEDRRLMLEEYKTADDKRRIELMALILGARNDK